MINYDFTPVNKFKSTSLTCVLNDSVIIKCFRKNLKISLKPNLKTYFETFLKSKNSGKIFDVKMNLTTLLVSYSVIVAIQNSIHKPSGKLIHGPLDPRSSVLCYICSSQREFKLLGSGSHREFASKYSL